MRDKDGRGGLTALLKVKEEKEESEKKRKKKGKEKRHNQRKFLDESHRGRQCRIIKSSSL